MRPSLILFGFNAGSDQRHGPYDSLLHFLLYDTTGFQGKVKRGESDVLQTQNIKHLHPTFLQAPRMSQHASEGQVLNQWVPSCKLADSSFLWPLPVEVQLMNPGKCFQREMNSDTHHCLATLGWLLNNL